MLGARLNTSDTDSAKGAIPELQRIIARLRRRWKQTRIMVRGDSGFGREYLMKWCENHPIDEVFGLRKNLRLSRAMAKEWRRSKHRCLTTGKPSRRFRGFNYGMEKSWSRSRRVVGKAEWLPDKSNARLIVTSLSKKEYDARWFYEELYCARGNLENVIKEQQLELFADRTATATMRANQWRRYFSGFTSVLFQAIKHYGLKNTEMASAHCGTIRKKLLKITGQIRLSAR